MRSQPVAVTEVTLGDGHFLMVHLTAQLLSPLLVGLPGREGGGGIPVDRSLADDRHVMQLVAIDKRTVVLQEGSLPPCLDHRQVIPWLGGELQHGILLQFQADITLKVDRSIDQIGALRHDDMRPILLLRHLHRLVEGRFAVFHAIALGPHLQNAHLVWWHLSAGNLFEDGITLGYTIMISRIYPLSAHHQTEQQQHFPFHHCIFILFTLQR